MTVDVQAGLQAGASACPAREILGSRKSVRRSKLPLPVKFDVLLQLFGKPILRAYKAILCLIQIRCRFGYVYPSTANACSNTLVPVARPCMEGVHLQHAHDKFDMLKGVMQVLCSWCTG